MNTKLKQSRPEDIAEKYLQELYSPNYAGATEQYLGENYIEHQLSAGFSRVGLEAYVRQRLEGNPSHEIIVHRVVAQGERVFLHVEERLNNEESYARGEMFLVNDGKIVEHWSTAQLVPKDKSDYMFGGASVNGDSTAGIKYTQMMKTAYVGFIGKGDVEAARRNTTSDYSQHNPKIEDGKEALLDFVRVLDETVNEADKTLSFHGTVASGDFVVLHCYADFPPLFPKSHIFDIFRITEDGKLAEHWDIIEPLESEDDLEKVY